MAAAWLLASSVAGVQRVAGQAIRKKGIWSKKDLSLNPDRATFQKGDLALTTEALYLRCLCFLVYKMGY